jgi:hypothetical protein
VVDCVWRLLIERGVSPLTVIKHFDVFEQRLPGRFAGGVGRRILQTCVLSDAHSNQQQSARRLGAGRPACPKAAESRPLWAGSRATASIPATGGFPAPPFDSMRSIRQRSPNRPWTLAGVASRASQSGCLMLRASYGIAPWQTRPQCAAVWHDHCVTTNTEKDR